MFSTFTESIWLYPNPIDFRKQIDGIVILIADHLQLNPASGQLFLFRNRTANKLKMLWWDKNGFWLLYKRLEKGKLKFPEKSEKVLDLSSDQLMWLLSGLNFLEQKSLPTVTAKNFF